MSDSITINGAMMLLLFFVFIIIFSVLGGPVDSIMDSILGMDGLESSDEIDTYVPLIKTAARIAFALGISVPAVWFTAKVFSREPAHYYYTNDKRRGGRTF